MLVQAYPVVEDTHLARLHYRCLSTTTHLQVSVSLTSFSFVGHFSVHFPLHLQTWLSTETRTILAWHHSHQLPKQDVSHFTCHYNFLLHFQFQMDLRCNLGVFQWDFPFGIANLSSKNFQLCYKELNTLIIMCIIWLFV